MNQGKSELSVLFAELAKALEKVAIEFALFAKECEDEALKMRYNLRRLQGESS